MDLIVDGLIYQMQAHGGISRIYSEIFPQMCDMEPELRVKIFTSGLCLQDLPQHERISHDPPQAISRHLYPSWFWNPIMEKWVVPARKYARQSSMDNIWHSTYYTIPEEWKGRQVVTVVDMIQEKLPTMFSDSRNERLRARKKRCIQNADLVICISELTRQDIHTCYGTPLEKMRVIHLSHSRVFRQMESTDDGQQRESEPYILYLGSRDPYKNFPTLLKAYQYWKWRDNFKLAVVGYPWSEAEQHLLVEIGLDERVHLLKWVDDEHLCRLYNRAAAFIYPSLYEGFGIPLLEAMACGCPLVASDIPSTREIAGDIPIYFDPQDVGSLIAALEDAVSMDREDERVNRGRVRSGEFSWKQTARQTLDLYYSLN